VGGPAERFYVPGDLDDLCEFMASLPSDEPLHWLGLGSNLLVRDGGIPGTVIATQRLDRLFRSSATRVGAEAGVACPKLARHCAREGLRNAEFFAGIPGTVGGALAMNAGAFGGETWEIVASVLTVDRSGALHRRTPSDYSIGYREVVAPADEWFVAGEFELESGEVEVALAKVRELLRRRGETQPTGQRSCGSVFRNPPGDFAGRLIEASGLKGVRIGGAMVSPKHANFIINTGGASAGDIEALIAHVQARVEERQGVRLTPEVHVLGLPESGTER
jgi:UDP-N-acetylmuramate dehydrogenase